MLKDVTTCVSVGIVVSGTNTCLWCEVSVLYKSP